MAAQSINKSALLSQQNTVLRFSKGKEVMPLEQVCFDTKIELSLKALNRIKHLRLFAAERGEDFRQLSNREREVLTLICQGFTNEEIAARIVRSVHTIRTHRNNIWAKLRIRNVVEAVQFGQAFELV